MTNTNKIRTCFNSGAYSYDSEVDIQPKVAQSLAKRLPKKNVQTLVEIGCGTGLLSRYLPSLFPEAAITLSDLAPLMIEVCKKRFEANSNVVLKCFNGQNFALTTPADLIVSSMALQWFNDLKNCFQNISKQLNIGGHFVFAMLGKNSLCEWSEVCGKLGNSPTPVFPSKEEVQSFLPNLKIETEVIHQSYKNTYAFLKKLKSIGANAPREGHIPYSSGMLRQIMRKLDERNVCISYEIIYGSYIKL